MLLHIDWVTSLTSTVRKYTQVPVEDYIDLITIPGVPLDLVGLTVLCCIFHIHVSVFFNNGCWWFGIVFHLNLTFTETLHTGWSEKYLFWIQTRQAQGKMPSHNCTHVPGLLKHELPALPADKESDIVQLSEDNNEIAVDFKPKQELKREVKCFVSGTVQKLVTRAKITLVHKQIKLKCQNSASIATQSSAVSTTTALPSQSSAFSTTTTVPPKKACQIGGARLKGPQVCPVCGQLEKSQSTLNIHISAQYPGYQFPCTVCVKSYASYNS